MRKNLLVAIAAVSGFHVSAQKMMHGHFPHPVTTAQITTITTTNTQHKGTAAGSTYTLSNIPATDTARTIYSHTGAGSGYVTGTNSYNDKGFAERYSFTGSDSSVKITGVYAQFAGTLNPASSRSVMLKVWMGGGPVRIKDSLYYNGFPGTAIDSVAVPVTQLGIDTVKQHMFATPTANLSVSFFVGYTIDYNYTTLNGDTIGLATSLDGHRNTNDYTFRYITNVDGDTTSADTILNVQNATLWSDGMWYDNYTQNDSTANNLAIYPIVVIAAPTGISSITKNALTFYGSYPNPASDNVSIRYALSAAADVTISIMDLTGRLVSTAKERSESVGDHTMQLNTSSLAAGEYIYTIRTSAGDGLASKLTIIK